MKTITEEEATKNTTLDEPVQRDSELKRWLVDYVGLNSEEFVKDDEITVQMIVDTIAEEFPEFLMVVAEENWIRGYHQALYDVEEGRKLVISQSQKNSDEEWIEGYNRYQEDIKKQNNE